MIFLADEAASVLPRRALGSGKAEARVLVDENPNMDDELRLSSYEPRSRTRETILATMRVLLRDRPLDGLRMEDVAQAAGVSRRTLYNQFDGLETLFRTSCEQLINELARHVRTDLPQEEDPEAALSVFGLRAATLFADERYRDIVRQVLRVGDGHTWLDETRRRLVRDPLVIAVENHLLRHRRTFGALDARATAAQFITMIESVSVWPALLKLQPDALHIDDVQIAGHVRAFVAAHRRRRTSERAA